MSNIANHPLLRRPYIWPALILGVVILVFLMTKVSEPALPFGSKPSGMAHLKLRIMALGDSITEGYRSSDGNGYRLQLLRKLEKQGSEVEYVGMLHWGNMTNNDNEGYGGLAIKQIASMDGVQTTLKKRPNLVLLHAGTNDMHTNSPEDPYESAPQRLGSLIDQVYDACPEAVVVVAQIIQCSCPFPGSELRIPVFNEAIRGLVEERQQLGKKISTINMSSIGVRGANLADGLHPNDAGYEKMAALWAEAIAGVVRKGWIREPQ